MAQISALAISEAVRVDSRRVAEIVAELGETSAQHVIGLALEQLAAALTAVRARLLRVGNRSLTAIWDRTALA